MSGTTNIGRVPRLRFPEFGGAWEKKPLEKIGYFTGGGTPSKDNGAYWTGEIPWISSSDLTVDSIDQINISRFITKQAVQDSATKLVPAKSILLVSRVGVGKLAVSTFPLCTSQDFTNFTPTAANPLFLAYLLKSSKEALLSFNQGTSIKGFTKDNIASLRLGFPSPAEQQKIADCLSSLDDLITLEAQKLDSLKAHKKGLMQQLFPREGETQPRLRFPEFENAGEWVLKKLEEVSPSVFDGTHQTPTYTPEGVPFYSVENLISGNANKFISRDDYLLATKKNRAEKGDILITRIGKIGYSQLVTWDHDFSVYVTLAVIKKSKAFNSHFLSHFMQSDFYQSELRARSLPNAVPPKINLDSLRSTEVLLPNDAEQQRIASCLTSLDDLITAQTQKLEALKTHKKGLMQQLFPQVSEE